MSKLLELADRVEALTGPDREVDCLIVTTLCPGATVGEYVGYEDVVFHAEAIGIPNKEICPFFTASIDAAMTLVPETIGRHMTMPSVGRYTPELWQAGVHVPGPRLKSHIAYAATPALALCAASLRARHAVEGEVRG